MDAALRELLDKQEIHDVLADYAQGVDHGSADLIDSAYHPGAVDVHSTFEAVAPGIGKKIVERNARAGCVGSLHRITNERIHVSGDAADGESYFHASMLFEVAGRPVSYEAHGRYLDRFERRDGRWKIAERQVEILFAYYVPVPDWRPEANSPVATLGLHTGLLTRR